MKEAKNSRAGKVGVSKAINISQRSGWETGDAEDNRAFGSILTHEHSKQSDHKPGLTEFEKHSGHNPLYRKGSPTNSKTFEK
jgi:hypothetical protein